MSHLLSSGGGPDISRTYVRWTWCRAVLHRGWWLVTSVYLVLDAHLSGAQLVLIGVAQAATGLACEVPAGALADTIGRRWALIASHVLMGTAMLATGLVTSFPALVATQMLWGLSWNLSSGADVAWITDELDDPIHIAGVLLRSGRAQLTGAAAGLVTVGGLATAVGRSQAMVAAGVGMLLLGGYVVIRFPERRFVRSGAPGIRGSWSALVRGSALVRRSRVIRTMVAATFLINGAAVVGLLQTRRLIELGFPATPILWFTALGIVTVLAGAAVFRFAENHVDDGSGLLRAYSLACAAGAAAVVVLAAAPDAAVGAAAVVVAGGVALPLTGTLATIWVNRQSSSDVRATVLSFLGQAEFSAEIVCGLGIAGVARAAGMVAALLTCAALFAAAVILVIERARSERIEHS